MTQVSERDVVFSRLGVVGYTFLQRLKLDNRKNFSLNKKETETGDLWTLDQFCGT